MRIFSKKSAGILLVSLLSPVVILAQEPEGILLTGLFTDSADIYERDVLEQNVAKAFNTRMVWAYDQTNIITGPLEALSAAKNIVSPSNGLEEPLLSEISGYQKKTIAHSAGTITAVNLAKQGKLWGDELYLVSPALISQNDLRQIRDLTSQGKGFNKITLYTGDDIIPDFKEVRVDFSDYTVKAKIAENFEVLLTKVVYEDRGVEINLLKDFLNRFVREAEVQIGKEPLAASIYGDISGNKSEIKWKDGTTESFYLQRDTVTGENFQDEAGIEVVPLYEGFPHGMAQLEFLGKFYKDRQRMPGNNKDDLVYFKQSEQKLPKEITTANDPNEIFVFPEGDVKPGTELAYTINYENIGEGIAFGVYITDVLEEDLDASTLAISNGGSYDSDTRTLSWFIGEAGPGQKGSVSFKAKVKADALDKTEIINFATIYFPSVPQATRTNGVVNRVAVSMDNVPPITTILPSILPNSAGWNNSDVMVSFSAVDNDGGSGVAKIEYSFDNTNWDIYTVPFTITAEGLTNVYYKSIDNAGSAELTKIWEIKLDKTLPVITSLITPQSNSSGWNNSDVNVSFGATDIPSGISSISEPVTVSAEGREQRIGGQAVDLADNISSAFINLNIDRVSPAISFNLEPYKMHLPFRQGNINLYLPFFYRLVYSTSDNLSGIGSMKAGLVFPSISGFKQQFIKVSFTKVIFDEHRKNLIIMAPNPGVILNQIKTGIFLINNNQVMHLNLRPKAKVWSIIKSGQFFIISAPSINFKAEARDAADNVSIANIQYLKKIIPLPEYVKSFINSKQLTSQEVEELLDDATIDGDTLKNIWQNYKIR